MKNRRRGDSPKGAKSRGAFRFFPSTPSSFSTVFFFPLTLIRSFHHSAETSYRPALPVPGPWRWIHLEDGKIRNIWDKVSV